MTTANTMNVINLQPAGVRATASANRILLECRDMAVRQLRTALRAFLQGMEEELTAEADVCMDVDKRRHLNGLNALIREKGGRVEGLLAAHWITGFDKSLRETPNAGLHKVLQLDELQIVDFGDMDEDLALKSMAGRLQDKFESDLYALGRRLNYLIGRETDNHSENPTSPQILTGALKAALSESGFDTPHRLELLKRLEPVIETHVGPIYQALNAHLIQQNILPNLRRDYGRATTAHGSKKPTAASAQTGDMFSVLQSLVSGTPTPSSQGSSERAGIREGGIALPNFVPSPQLWASLEAMQQSLPAPINHALPGEHTNVLHTFRVSEVGQGLQQLDAITVDIVAMLFDMIFDDREISDPIKAMVGKLQIPVLKVAMLDRSFFSSKAHPTRHLLDVISSAALRWSEQIGYDDPVYRKISEVIDQIHDNFKQDTALFAVLCDDLERFLKQQEEAGETTANRAALLVVQRELDELADIAISVELQSFMTSTSSAVVIDLLDHEWRAVLKHIHLREGPGSESWNQALETASTLVDSVQPKNEGNRRQSLARVLPSLLKQLSDGFDRIGLESSRRHHIMDALFAVHAALLRGIELPVETPHRPTLEVVPAEPTLASHSLADGDITVESISVTVPLLISDIEPMIDSLQRGDWVEYVQAEAPAIRYRLSWISPQRGIFLFTNPQSPHALAVSPEAMSLQLRRGEVRILSTEPIFDRALTRTIDTLQAA